MRKLLTRRRVSRVVLLILALAAVPSAAAAAAAEEDVVAALRARVVRPILERTLSEEARFLRSRLTVAELEALVAGEPLPARLERPRAGRRRGLGATTAELLGDTDSDLAFVPLPPCRVFDTRNAGGAFAANEARSFRVAGGSLSGQGGNPAGCGIPLGATQPAAAAVALNLIAVSAQGYGWVSAWEFGQAPQTASALNFSNVQVPFDIANTVLVSITGVAAQTHDLTLQVANSASHLVGDVTGYFTRVPVEGLKSLVVHAANTTLIDLSDAACKELVTCTVTAPVAGKVVVDAQAQIGIGHTAGTLDRFALQVETAGSVACTGEGNSVDASDFEVSSALGTDPGIDFTLVHRNVFSQAAAQVRTYRVSGAMKNGAGTGDVVETTRAICTFIPD